MSYGQSKRFEPIHILGILATIALHGGVVVGVILYRQALMAASNGPPPESYVVAKLVRLGKPRDPKMLPKKHIPQPATKKEETVDYSADADDAPNKTQKKEKKDAKLSDKLRNSLEKADLLAQAQQEIEQEGDPNGVPNGTATSAQAGDPYITKIADLWNRTWSLPAVIPSDEASSLYVLIVIHIDQNGAVQFPIQFDRPSGNTIFDNSITTAWKRIGQIPLPPPDRFASIMANGLALKLNWKGIQ